MYSEYDSVHSTCILNPSIYSSLEADTSIFYGKTVQYFFTPTKVGKHIISGTYYELDADFEYVHERNIAYRNFTFEYDAVR